LVEYHSLLGSNVTWEPVTFHLVGQLFDLLNAVNILYYRPNIAFHGENPGYFYAQECT